jgi:hypothetical protein
MGYPSERQYYRLDFPLKERPELLVGSDSMPVVEVSERGLRFEPAPSHASAIGDRLQGVVRFRRAGEVDITGTISRAQGSSLVLILEGRGVPYAAILEEQRYLMRHYPARFQRKPT